MAGPLIHLVTGGTGAGKSTYSMRLADDLGGLRFSIDPWMTTLYWEDAPAQLDFHWAKTRVDRCVRQMCEVAAQAAGRGVPSVFDAGFTTREDRAAVETFALDQGFAAQLHWVDADPITRWTRVRNRNIQQGETFAFEVTRGMFDFMERLWEAPSDEEMARLNGIRID